MMHLYHNGEVEKFATMVKQAFYVVISIALPLIVVMLFSATEVVHVLFGQQFEQAIICLQVTTPLLLIVSLSGIFGFQVLSALSKDNSILSATVIGMSVSILLSFALVPYLKALGESITILLTELSVCLSFIYFTNKYFTLKGYIKIFVTELFMLVPYIVMIFLIKMVVSNEMLRLIFIALGSGIWFILYHTMVSKNKLLFEQVKNLIRSKQSI
jgi:O-antigen/teichoic acid export membrane protein